MSERKAAGPIMLGSIIVIAVMTAGYFLYPLGMLAVKMARSSCPIPRALEAVRALTRKPARERIARESRLLQSDDAAGLVQVQTPDGPYWVPKGTEPALSFFLGQQEERIYGAGDRGVHAGDAILDCGANVGVYTRLALRSGASKVVAIEPAPDNIESLRRNFAEEIRTGRVIVYPKGVWDREGILMLHVFPHNSGADSFVVSGPAQYHDVPAPLTTIDRLVEELGLARVDLIKMDIKGAAPQALAGAKATLSKFHPRLAISTEEPADSPDKVRNPILDGWSGYTPECGFCLLFREGFIPQVMLYR